MRYKIIVPASYKKKVVKFLKKHPSLKETYSQVIRILELDPFHPSLKTHRLKGNLKDLHAISLNLSYRVTLKIIIKNNEVILVDIGGHDSVY